MRDEALWRRLESYRFAADDTPTPFVKHLMREEGWGRGLAEDVVEEYRRFLYLSQVADAEVTPCRRVDRAWHLHLAHSRDYWERLCAGVLGKPLHHDPARGPEDEARLAAQYDATRRLYAEEFGQERSNRIWRPRWHATAARCSHWAFLLGFLLLLPGLIRSLGEMYASKPAVTLLVLGLIGTLYFGEPGHGGKKRSGRTIVARYGDDEEAGAGCGGGGE